MSKKILFLDHAHPILMEELTKHGFVCETDTIHSIEVVQKNIPEYCGIVMRSRLTLSHSFIDAAMQLKFIAREGVGLEHIPVDYAQSKGITVINSPEGSKDTVAEHAMGLLLMMLNNLASANQEVKENQWIREKNRGIELMGLTVGIIGYGNMGHSFARRLKGFGVRVLAYDKFKTNYGDEYAAAVSLPMLQKEADIVSLHIPYTKENVHFFKEDLILGFTKNIFVINTARGLVLNTADLVKYLKKGKIRGAALDVLEYEDQSFDKFRLADLPSDFKYLQKANQVVLSPHIAGWSFESKQKHGEVLAEKILRLMKPKV